MISYKNADDTDIRTVSMEIRVLLHIYENLQNIYYQLDQLVVIFTVFTIIFTKMGQNQVYIIELMKNIFMIQGQQNLTWPATSNFIFIFSAKIKGWPALVYCLGTDSRARSKYTLYLRPCKVAVAIGQLAKSRFLLPPHHQNICFQNA